MQTKPQQIIKADYARCPTCGETAASGTYLCMTCHMRGKLCEMEQVNGEDTQC